MYAVSDYEPFSAESDLPEYSTLRILETPEMPIMGTLVNNEDPDKMLQNAVFHNLRVCFKVENKLTGWGKN